MTNACVGAANREAAPAAEAHGSPAEALRRSQESRRKTSVDRPPGHMQGIREASSQQEAGSSSQGNNNSGQRSHMEAAAAAAVARQDGGGVGAVRQEDGGSNTATSREEDRGSNAAVLRLLGGAGGGAAKEENAAANENAASGESAGLPPVDMEADAEGEDADEAAEEADRQPSRQESGGEGAEAAAASKASGRHDVGRDGAIAESSPSVNPYSSLDPGEGDEDDKEGKSGMVQRMKDRLGLGGGRGSQEAKLQAPDKDTTAVPLPEKRQEQQLGQPSSKPSTEPSSDIGPIWSSRESMQSATEVLSSSSFLCHNSLM